VSLEVRKWVEVLHRLGHKSFYFAGELDPPIADDALLSTPVAGAMLDERAHFKHPTAVWIQTNAFGTAEEVDGLRARLEEAASELEESLLAFVRQHSIDLLVPQNVFALPLNIPLSVALRRVLVETGLPAIAHNHDFYWERERFSPSNVQDILHSTFPPVLPTIQQVVINSPMKQALAQRGIDSTVVPNVFDYARPVLGPDDYNADLRAQIGLDEGDLFFLQPTRVVRRKGIELAIELVSRLDDLPIKLVITHHADPAESDAIRYLEELRSLAARSHVDLQYVPDRFEPARRFSEQGEKIYSLWDAYVYADFITYPTRYEGFGNALLETLYFRKPLFVNRYSVYKADIEPHGLDVIAIDGEITESAVEAVRSMLKDSDRLEMAAAHNASVAREHFSYQVLQKHLQDLLAGIR
jgi:glycosyltransferase involved in cell wall biosynthesis